MNCTSDKYKTRKQIRHSSQKDLRWRCVSFPWRSSSTFLLISFNFTFAPTSLLEQIAQGELVPVLNFRTTIRCADSTFVQSYSTYFSSLDSDVKLERISHFFAHINSAGTSNSHPYIPFDKMKLRIIAALSTLLLANTSNAFNVVGKVQVLPSRTAGAFRGSNTNLSISTGDDMSEQKSLDISKTVYSQTLKSPKDAYLAFAEKGASNAKMAKTKILHQSILGGAYVGFGGLLSFCIAGNLGGISAANPGIAKMAFASLFPGM